SPTSIAERDAATTAGGATEARPTTLRHGPWSRSRVLEVGVIFAFIGRQLGRILTLALNWATIVLFGRVPQDRQLHLSGMALTALVRPIVLAGIAFDGCPRDRGRTEARVTRPGRRRSASLRGSPAVIRT